MELKTGALILLAAVIAVSGCIEPSSQQMKNSDPSTGEQEKIDHASCDEMRIQIDQASNTAMIRQMNEKPIGEVQLRWSFENGETASKTLNLSRRGQIRFMKSGVSGNVQSLKIVPLRCPEKTFSSE